MEIKLTKEHRGLKSTSFSGRPQGEQVRRELSLNNKDIDNNKYEILIPSGTTSFNASFYLGLFFDSITRLKSIEEFKKKYSFKYEDENEKIVDILKNQIKDNEREANNEINNITGLD